VFNPSRPSAIPVRRVDISKARKLLGFEPSVSLDDGLADAVKWYRENCAAAARGG
jgi:nucleoside-diphosphate-sugar epimerase